MSKYAQVNVKFGADISQFSTAMQNAAREMKKAGDQLKNVGQSMTMNLTAPIVAFGAAALYSFGQIDSLKRGLISFSGSAQLAEEEFTKLREVAKLPGIGLEEAVRGSINLQAIGLSADDARKAMSAFGNAIATVGGGKENFDLAIRGFSQLMNASKPLQQDLYQIANQLPQVNKLMIEAFGTNRAEDLAKMGISGKQLADFLVTELEKLPKISGGIKNSFENMSDSVKISLASFGESIEKNFNISGKIDALSQWLADLVQGFKNLDPIVQKFILGALGVVAALGPLSFVLGGIITLLPTLLTGIAALGTAFTFMSGPIGMAIVGLGLISALLYKVATDTTRYEDSEVELAKTISDANAAISTQKTKVEELHTKLQDTNISQTERNKLIKEFNEIAGTNLTNIGNETTFQNNLAKAYKDVNEQMQAKKFQILDIARTQKQADLEKLNQDIKLAEIAAEKYNKENVLLETPFGNLTKTPISDLFGTPIDQLNDLRDQAEAARQSIQGLSRELYKISPSGDVAGIKQDKITPTNPTGEGLTPEELKRIEDAKWKAFLESKGRQMDDIKERNKRVIQQMETHTNKVDQVNSKLISDQLKTNVAYKSVLDTTALDLDIGLSKQLERYRQHVADMQQMAANMGQILQQGIQSMIVDLASAFGENLVDGDPFKNLGNILLGSLGKLMVALGTQMIVLSSLGAAFQTLMSNPATWGAAIPVGIAMVAAGAAISKIAAKGMQGSSGSVSGGSSSYSGGSSSSQGNDLVLTTRLDGRDLVMSGENTSYVRRR